MLITEIRSIVPDHLWLSPAFGADTLELDLSGEVFDVPAVLGLCAEIEDLMRPAGRGRHWGMLMFGTATQLAPHFPLMANFRALAVQFDPTSKVRNAFLHHHVFG